MIYFKPKFPAVQSIRKQKLVKKEILLKIHYDWIVQYLMLCDHINK